MATAQQPDNSGSLVSRLPVTTQPTQISEQPWGVRAVWNQQYCIWWVQAFPAPVTVPGIPCSSWLPCTTCADFTRPPLSTVQPPAAQQRWWELHQLSCQGRYKLHSSSLYWTSLHQTPASMALFIDLLMWWGRCPCTGAYYLTLRTPIVYICVECGSFMPLRTSAYYGCHLHRCECSHIVLARVAEWYDMLSNLPLSQVETNFTICWESIIPSLFTHNAQSRRRKENEIGVWC